ncbi:PREDICTED: TNF receptor-associated factor 5-like [Amphimedon queenslandica]|uniref:RING-type E3 ubiquitin transferase n=1 Tax=Amphimedon queenslandica TaxID=400682 RepID=A0A1X7U807_AMPQE|nr:PREDICTED: TNF receptor-associated factor 5-like [Amphimedon queenslandica]|eukprot:XP_011405866.1 PREDICTED: TNF receptor-associated factor 5-like [Amphimedon queenslandica]
MAAKSSSAKNNRQFIGGYDYQFISPFDQHCSICMLVPREPVKTSCCGKSFCSQCLNTLKEHHSRPTCPNCRSQKITQSSFDKEMDKRIKELVVYCSHKRGGCEWRGKVRDVDGHMSACKHQLVECPNGCTEIVYPHTLDGHMKDTCPHREAICQYCSLRDRHNIITGSRHIDECPEIPVPCHNKECQEIVIRREMSAHVEECPKEMVPCTYAKAGCSETVKREDLESHNKDRLKLHLDIAMKQIEEFGRSNETLSTKVNSHKIMKLDEYTKHKEEKTVWYSPAFYSSPGGYKMCLSVFCNGNGGAANHYISCFVHLLSGDYDDTLEWPFKGEVSLELLNQMEDKCHEKELLRFSEGTPVQYRQRVRGKEIGRGGGLQEFIPHSELGLKPTQDCQYLKDDSLYFRVSVKVTSKTRPWLVM